MAELMDKYVKKVKEMSERPIILNHYKDGLPVSVIHAYFRQMTVNEEDLDFQKIKKAVEDLCTSIIAFEEVLLHSKDKSKASGIDELYDVFEELESLFSEEVIK